MVFQGSLLVFRGSRLFCTVPDGLVWLFMIPGRFLWFQVGFGGFSRLTVGFSWFQVFFLVTQGFSLVVHGFMSVFIFFFSKFQVSFYGARSVFMVFQDSRLISHGSR